MCDCVPQAVIVANQCSTIPSTTWTRKQLMKRSSILAKQVIGIESAHNLGFVSQLWLDTATEKLNVMQHITALYKQTALLPKRRLPASRCEVVAKLANNCKWNSGHHSSIWPEGMQFTRRQLCTVASLVAILTFNQGLILESVKAVDKTNNKEEDDGVFGTIKSIFDPNEKTKSGKVLPKSYLKSAREVVKTLRESLKEDPKDMAKFRRTADAAKESIREYLNNWKGQQAVAKEESYMELEKVFRSLANFYAKAGPSASLSVEVKSEILHHLDIADKFL